MNHSVNKNEIIVGLSQLGLKNGDTVMVHSSLSSFGQVVGGAGTVVEALLEVIGRDGTLVVPTFSKYLTGEEKVWDRENTPSLMGIISETVRNRPDAIRSSHAAHPLSAIGQKAGFLCSEPYKTGFGPDSPFKKLVETDAWILLMGVDYNRCTMIHLLEAEVNVPYRFLEERKGIVVINGVKNPNGSAWEYTKQKGVSNDFLPFGKLMEEEGIVTMQRIGNSVNRLFKAKDMYQLGMKMLRLDIHYLIKHD